MPPMGAGLHNGRDYAFGAAQARLGAGMWPLGAALGVIMRSSVQEAKGSGSGET